MRYSDTPGGGVPGGRGEQDKSVDVFLTHTGQSA
jgi:hypothetical protein